ncbi:outer membrane protein assembly factor BamD [Bacteriovoracaceae bacterium]|nr:outer membrane protein assembly factor BamD [Bacteriovoracaceae bacterium]
MKQIFIIFMIQFIISCASERPKGKTEAEVLFKEAQELMDEERYLLAIEKLNVIKNQFTYSYYAKPAELLHADVLFYQENYLEAASSYMLYRDFHPKDPRIEYVIYKIAESYFMQLPDTYDRDLQSADEAIRYYEELTTKYPKTQFKNDSIEKINRCKEMKKQKDLYIADFYYRTDEYLASRYWYKDIFKNHQEKKTKKLAAYRIIDASYKAEKYKECLENYNLYSDQVSKSDRERIEDIQKDCLELKETEKENTES